MYFKNRLEAGDLLAEGLFEYLSEYLAKHPNKHQLRNPLVLGVPRGGIPLAKRVAERLGGDLDVVLVHKIGAPENPEYAIGSVTEFGTVYPTEAITLNHLSAQEIESLGQKEIEKLRERRKAYSPVRSPIPPAGRIVLLVDDGIATGATMLAALRAIRSQKPERVIVATPVISRSAKKLLSGEADEVFALYVPDHFFAISQFYENFPQVTDQEVLAALSSK